MSKIKVVHIITKMELGGAQQNTLFTVTHLNPEKFQTYLVMGKGGELFDEAQSFKNSFVVPDLIRTIQPFHDCKALLQIIRILKKIQSADPPSAPIIVHTHSSKAGILGRWAALFSKIPFTVHSIHGFGFHDYQQFFHRKFLILLEQITAPFTGKFIAVSQANIQRGLQLKIFPREKVRLIRSGIDIPCFQHSKSTPQLIKQHLKIPDKAPVVTMIACLKPQKAPLDYIMACEQIHRHIPDTHFLLVGDGRLRHTIEKEVVARRLTNHFHVLGWRRDIPEILHITHVLALTSLWEGLPRVLPQAMAAGLPVVASRVDGTPEAVRDGVNGFLIEPGDPSGAAAKVIWLLKNPEKAYAMGAKGRELVAEFDIHEMVHAQNALYDELIGDSHKIF